MIPPKVYSRMISSLLEFRSNPCSQTDKTLLADETEANWPYGATDEQLAEWKRIMDATRADFEKLVTARK
jgi:hypothetical protein